MFDDLKRHRHTVATMRDYLHDHALKLAMAEASIHLPACGTESG